MAERQYPLAGVSEANGWVKFDWEKDVIAIQAKYGNTLVTLRNGQSYLLWGRDYGI